MLNATGTADKVFYTHSPAAVGGIICREANGTKYWYHYDRLGNVVAVTDASGDPAALYTMDAFGNVLEVGRGDYYNEGADIQPYHLTTKEWDGDAGLYYFNARWYNAQVGTFNSKNTYYPQYMEMGYEFCAGNPVRYSDPDGNSPFDWWWNWWYGNDRNWADDCSCNILEARKKFSGSCTIDGVSVDCLGDTYEDFRDDLVILMGIEPGVGAGLRAYKLIPGFRRWFHRVYKKGMPKCIGKTHNRDATPAELDEAFEEWYESWGGR